jgi:hypothetical protein
MAIRHHLRRRIDDRIAKDIKSVGDDLVLPERPVKLTVPSIHSTLKHDYELSEVSQFRATINNDDVLAMLHYH